MRSLMDHGLGWFAVAMGAWVLVSALRVGVPPLIAAWVRNLDANTEGVKATTKAVVEIPATIENAERAILAAFTSGFAAVETRLLDQFALSRRDIVLAIEDERAKRTEGALRRIERQRMGSIPDDDTLAPVTVGKRQATP